MIKEELYVIKDGERCELDLPSPSGITLKWVSNLFSDISKLTCSYSYTFNLPMTANNRRVLDIADDIRHASSFARVKIDAEFLVNGVCLCPNANLYVSEVGQSAFSCVLTWRVLKAFETMKSDSIDINELPSIGTFTWKTGDDDLIYGKPSNSLKNTDSILYPNYDAGVPYEDGVPPKPVVPVYRLVQLINDYYGTKILLGREIKSGMGLLPRVNFNNKKFYGRCVYDDFLSYGVLPLTGIGVSNSTQRRYTISSIEGKASETGFECGNKVLYGIYEKWVVIATNQGTQDSIDVKTITKESDLSGWHRYMNLSFVTFSGNKYIQNTGYTSKFVYEAQSEDSCELSREQSHGNGTYWTRWNVFNCMGEIKQSYVIQKTDNKYISTGRSLFRCSVECELRGEAEVRVKKDDIKEGKAELKDYWWIYILQIKQGSDDKEADVDTYSDESDDWMGLRSISREDADTEYVYHFDFGVKYDVRKLTIDAADDDEVGLCFWSGSYEEGWSEKGDDEVSSTGITYTNIASLSYLRIMSITPKVQFEGLPVEMEIIENLPDISCYDLIKNLFLLNGALPRVEKDGETITAMFYNQLRDRVVSGDCLDWSDKMLLGVNENSTSTKTYNSNFGQKNYFLMASNEKDKTDEEKLEEIELYGDGYGLIEIDDKRLDENKDVFTSCFYPGLRQDLAYPNMLTGRTMKVWDGEKQIQSSVNPIIGYVNYRALDSVFEDISNVSLRPMLKTYGADFKHIRMNTFEPFEEMDEFYGYLKSILDDYVVVKEKFMLNEFDLKDFDESVPIYLQKYNCCFAVSTIQRDKSGVSTVELVKLPFVTQTYATPEEIDTEQEGYSYRVTNNFFRIELSLLRDYTSNDCPICYELFVNNEHTWFPTSGNTLYEPISGTYISRYVFPYEADKLKGDSYSLNFFISPEVNYEISKTIGLDVVYTKNMVVKLRVYYDDVRCEAGKGYNLTFTKSDFGKYHIFKFIYDIYTPEGELLERVRKKMYYFVSKVDESCITDDFGDEHEDDNSVKVNDVTIIGNRNLINTQEHKYTLSFTPENADVDVKSVEVLLDGSMATSVLVSNVTISGFSLTALELPSNKSIINISIMVKLEDDTMFTKTSEIIIAQPSIGLVKVATNSDSTEIEAVNGIGTATYKVYINPFGVWCTIINVLLQGDNAEIEKWDENSFTLNVSNITKKSECKVLITAEYEGLTLTDTFIIPINFIDMWSVKMLDELGVLVVDRNGKFYTSTEWEISGNDNSDADGIAVSDGEHRFILSKKNFTFSNTEAGSTAVDGQYVANDESSALSDFGGKKNTDALIIALSSSFAQEIRNRNDFPSGKEAYCASIGEWNLIGNHRTQINEMLSIIGGEELYYKSASCDYLSSTRKGNDGKWYAHFGASVSFTGALSGQTQGRSLAEVVEAIPVKDGSIKIEGNDSFTTKNGTGSAIYVVSYAPEDLTISEVSMSNSDKNVVLAKTSDEQFTLSVSGVLANIETIVTIKARLNGLMRTASKCVSIKCEMSVDYEKLDVQHSLILTKDYSLYTAEEWAVSGKKKDDVEGIAVSDGTHRFIIALDDTARCYFGGFKVNIDGLSDSRTAFNGEANTQSIVDSITGSDGYFTEEPYSAAAIAQNYLFPSGKCGFIGSYAEWELVDNYYTLIESLIKVVNGTSLVKNFSYTYWASTKGRNDNISACVYHCYIYSDSINRSLGAEYRTNRCLVRPFRKF